MLTAIVALGWSVGSVKPALLRCAVPAPEPCAALLCLLVLACGRLR